MLVAVVIMIPILLAGPAEAVEIWDIQGAGLSSAFEGEEITTSNNTVTAVGSRFFVMQTPDNRTDDDPWTSDGIVVVDDGAFRLAVGDRVTVRGTVVEWYDQTELRIITDLSITSSGHPRPARVDLDASTPVADQPWPVTELERFEGMWVGVRDGVVTGPTDRYGDAVVTASGHRLFREPGILWPGEPNLPVWDGNPESFEIDPDALGGNHRDLSAGDRFMAEGTLGYTYGSYQLWPVTIDLVEAVTFPGALEREPAGALTVASQNCRRLGEDGDLPIEDRLEKISRQIRVGLGSPSIIGLQEVETQAVLEDLADRILLDDSALMYAAHLVEGNDPSGIDVAFLVREGVPFGGVLQIGADARFSWDQSLLFDRPPLVLETSYAEMDVTVVVVHLRSLNGIDEPGDSGQRVRQKRFEQSQWLAEWVQQHQLERPADGLLVIGDLNAFQFTDGYVDVVGQIIGTPDPAGAMVPADTAVEPPLHNAVLDLPAGERYSFVYRGSAEVLDHALVDESLRPLLRRFAFARGNADAPEGAAADSGTKLRSSDHDGFVVTFVPPVRISNGRRAP